MRTESNYPPFHLSINKDGVVSLWDNAESARNAASHGEVYVEFELTYTQLVTLRQAQDRARNSKSYRQLRPGDVGYDYVIYYLKRGVWACDSYDHNDPKGCSNPDCFKNENQVGREWKPPPILMEP